MSIVISVENVSKAYRLGQIGGGTLKEDFARWCAKLQGKPDPNLKIGEEHHARHMGEQFWALDNVSFEVEQGEVLGIIGRNGAGKSTLLKILSQVTTPTSGEIKIKGRIASLLEVGTGFHPELTGRENIFLNGAILGMTKAEIRKKFDEIVDFSGVEEFIDTPVKRYSSGMYVRLAFAVAAHLEPEILVVDEVLAVGDVDFQKKCLGKMHDVAENEGRTIIFVSHDLIAVRKLCSHGIILHDGHLQMNGKTDDIIDAYLKLGRLPTDFKLRKGEGSVQVASLEIVNDKGIRIDRIEVGEFMKVIFHCVAKKDVKNALFAACFDTLEGTRSVSMYSSYKGQSFSLSKGYFSISCVIPTIHLTPGEYNVLTFVEANGVALDLAPNVRTFNVDINAKANFITIPNTRQGFFIEEFEWQNPIPTELAPAILA